jgi:hypothetical protein
MSLVNLICFSLAIQLTDCFTSYARIPGLKHYPSHADLSVQSKVLKTKRAPPQKFCMSGDIDWRTFRAKLVSQENKGSGIEGSPEVGSSMKGDEWVYDAGKFVETGCVILGGSQMEYGFGLRQQYFHKSVMLVLSQDERFTKGIIVNRPTSKDLDGWRLWLVACLLQITTIISR